ncbi:MAG: cysteine-rich CWC family protein [Thaumarchaeota archaeon]|nr:cysteine-rich CWC family protein [Nitrososphaerota archaeon]
MRCVKNFTRKGWIGCWCGSVAVSKERHPTIKAQTDAGVCPDCMKG